MCYWKPHNKSLLIFTIFFLFHAMLFLIPKVLTVQYFSNKNLPGVNVL